jgi:hypothetical protein
MKNNDHYDRNDDTMVMAAVVKTTCIWVIKRNLGQSLSLSFCLCHDSTDKDSTTNEQTIGRVIRISFVE